MNLLSESFLRCVLNYVGQVFGPYNIFAGYLGQQETSWMRVFQKYYLTRVPTRGGVVETKIESREGICLCNC